MIFFKTLASSIRQNKPVPFPMGPVLQAATIFQRTGMAIRLHRKRSRVNAYVASYGNITVGGVGKTPAVIARAQSEIEAGRQVAVLTRGYGVQDESKIRIWEPRSGQSAPTINFGDEAALISRLVPNVWIVRSVNRVQAAHIAIDHGCNFLLMDDGYQHVALERDENVLMIDAANPFGNGHLLPRGILREPLRAMNRATEIILTRCDQATSSLAKLENSIRQYAPDVPLLRTRHVPTHLWHVCDEKEERLDFLRNVPVHAVCAIGNPEAFANTLRSLGANIISMHALYDHAPIPPSLFNGKEITVVTEKDAMRISGVIPEKVYALAVSLSPFGE